MSCFPGADEYEKVKTSIRKQLYKTIRLRQRESGELFVANLFGAATRGDHFTTSLEAGKIVTGTILVRNKTLFYSAVELINIAEYNKINCVEKACRFS